MLTDKIDRKEFDLLCRQLSHLVSRLAMNKLSQHGFYGLEPLHANEAPATLEALQQAVTEKPYRGLFPVSMDYSDHTIYTSPHINMLMRAWHDLIHFETGAPFDLTGELEVCSLQVKEMFLQGGTMQQAKLLTIDIVGQSEYFEKFGEFPTDQKAFVFNYYNNGSAAALEAKS